MNTDEDDTQEIIPTNVDRLPPYREINAALDVAIAEIAKLKKAIRSKDKQIRELKKGKRKGVKKRG